MAPQPEGYWAPSTATLDWCEQNYELNYYIAEFWNTISNLAMIVPPIYSYVCSILYHNPVEIRFVLAYFTVLLVGIGSWLFHMTLRYEMQLFDEIPMVWGSLLLVYVLVTILHPHLDNSKSLQAGLIAYGVFVTYAYLQFVYPIIFQVSYGLLVVIVLYLDALIAKTRPCDPRLFYLSAALYHTGFFVWNIDNLFCSQLTQLRGWLPWYLRPLTQLHAIWHVLAGYGSYIHIFFCAQARNMQRKRKVVWKWSYVAFYLVFEDQEKAIQ